MRRKKNKNACGRRTWQKTWAARLYKTALAPQKENGIKKQPIYDAHEAINLAANEGEAAQGAHVHFVLIINGETVEPRFHAEKEE